MVLKEKIEKDLITAIKAHDSVRLNCLRLVKTAIISKEIADKISALDDAGVIAVLSSLAKRAQESIEQFEKGGRLDLVEKEKAELVVLRSYLPEALPESEILKLIETAVAESGAVSPKDMGKVMKALQSKVAGRADGKLVSALVQKRLIAKNDK